MHVPKTRHMHSDKVWGNFQQKFTFSPITTSLNDAMILFDGKVCALQLPSQLYVGHTSRLKQQPKIRFLKFLIRFHLSSHGSTKLAINPAPPLSSERSARIGRFYVTTATEGLTLTCVFPVLKGGKNQ